MAAIAGKRGFAAGKPTENCEEKIEKGKHCGKERKEENRRRMVFGGSGTDKLHGEQREEKSQKRAAGIAEENSCGREIENKERGACASQSGGDCQSGQGIWRLKQICTRKAGSNDKSATGSETIGTVEEVERIKRYEAEED